jgi:ribosome-associated protein
MIEITPELGLAEEEIEERFVRAPGPGGQNVNKVSSAVQLRWDAAHSAAISDAQFRRLKVIAGSRMTREGVIVLTAHTHRSQDLNRQDARARLAEMIRQALVAPKFRVPTRPTLAAKGRRLAAKKVRGEVKQGRGKFRPED